jgi:hypothetical protein
MDIFTNVFTRVGLKMNATKTKAMTMIGSKVYASISKIAYTWRVTGEGHTHRERNLQKVECELCGGMICRQHVTNHQKTRKCERGHEEWITNRTQMAAASTNATILEQHEELEMEMDTAPREYVFNMLKDQVPCPMDGCEYKTNIRGSMRRHFRARHLEDTMIIVEEGELP